MVQNNVKITKMGEARMRKGEGGRETSLTTFKRLPQSNNSKMTKEYMKIIENSSKVFAR